MTFPVNAFKKVLTRQLHLIYHLHKNESQNHCIIQYHCFTKIIYSSVFISSQFSLIRVLLTLKDLISGCKYITCTIVVISVLPTKNNNKAPKQQHDFSFLNSHTNLPTNAGGQKKIEIKILC